MPDIDWNREASLLRVTRFDTADDQEELVARGTVYELVGNALELPVEVQDGLVLRVEHDGDVIDHDGDAIREMAARPEYTSAHGQDDTADRPDDRDNDELAAGGLPILDEGVSAPSTGDSRGRDGQR